MAGIKTARAHFDGGMRFTAESGSGHALIMDVVAAEGGQDSGFSPMELPLVALIGCVGMDVVSILRKQRQDVTGYDLAVRGTRAEEHPKVFVAITVEHTITGRDLKRPAVERAIELSRTRYCSVSAMLGKTAEITHTFTLVEAPAE
ncbi:MAG TPA: OsmC family protein [Ktedonobacterales bacterium]|jgi:putative redox protein